MIENELPQSITSVTPEYQPVYDLSLVIPTRNEAGNIEPLLMRIHQAPKGIAAEVVFIDDSTDDTPEVIRKLQDWFPLTIKLIVCPTERRKNGLGDLRRHCHPSLHAVELWLDGAVGVWQVGDGATVPAETGEFPADQKPVVDRAGTHPHLAGGPII